MVSRARAGLASLRSDDAPQRRRIDDARREEILKQVEEVVLAEGFASLTVDDLSTRLQCSKSTLYAIASTKGDLVLRAMKRFFRDGAARVDESVEGIEDPSERIGAYLAAVGDGMRRLSAACYADMISFDATRDLYATNSLAAARRVREYIHEGVKQGAFRAVHAEFVAESVSLLIDGIQHGQLLERTGLSSGDAFAELSELVLAALTNKTVQGG